MTKRRPTVLLIYGGVALVLAGGWISFVAPMWADLRYRAAFADFLQAKRHLEDLATSEWQDRVQGTMASKADAVDAAARHIDACEEVGGLGTALHKDVERLDVVGTTLGAADKRELALQLASAAREYADAYQASLEDFCDKALDAVVAQMSPERGDDVIEIRRAASSILTAERCGAESSAGRIQTIWRKLDKLLSKGFGWGTR